MANHFYEKFIDFLEEYIDEEITKDERFKEQRHICAGLSKDKSSYEAACDDLDRLYRRLMCEKLFFVVRSICR